MAKSRPTLLSFNRGEVSKYALARVDVERLQLSAERQENWLPWVLGPMMLRPGTEYIGSTKGDAAPRLAPFIFSNADLALIELTAGYMRVWLVDDNGETLITRADVGTTITSGDFSSSSGWTTATSGTGAAATIGGGTLTLSSPAEGGYARCSQQVTVAAEDQNVEHAVQVLVQRGPVQLRIGSTAGGDDYVEETDLWTGYHSLAFTPTGDFHIRLETTSARQKVVDSITVESAGAMAVPTTWDADDLAAIRFDQDGGDIVFCACTGQRQSQIERRGANSWSVVRYYVDDGPFSVPNLSDIKMTPGALAGNTTLTASRAYFTSEMVGQLFRLFSSGQSVSGSLTASDTYSSTIRVAGVGSSRAFSYAITGTWAGTLTLQRSFDSATSGFQDVATFTVNTSFTFNDELDNSIVWYRIGFKSSAYTSGSADLNLSYVGGGAAGVCRVISIISETVVNTEILSAFSSLSATSDWYAGDWSDGIGWPSAVAFHDGRLFWAGVGQLWGSVSDSFWSHDFDYEGDAGPINRSLGGSGGEPVNWLLSLSRLIAGRDNAEVSVRSSSLDAPLTPTNLTLKPCSTRGSAPLPAVRIDARGIFAEKSGRRVYEESYQLQSQDYVPRDLTRLNLDIGEEGFVDLAVSNQPDTTVWFLRSDGQGAPLLTDYYDQVEAWWKLVTATTAAGSGALKATAVLPGTLEDRVYYAVSRTVNGADKVFIERGARRDQCTGQPGGRCADSHVIYSGSATTTIGGLDHLEGETVVVWGWNTVSPFTATLPDGTSVTVGRDLGTFTVSSGQISGLAASVTDACVGLGYDAYFKSAKLAYGAEGGTALVQVKQIDSVGLLLLDAHYQGLQVGQDFTTMDALPLKADEAVVADDTVWPDFEYRQVNVPGRWDTDSRLCLKASAPRPCMVAGVVLNMTTNEG